MQYRSFLLERFAEANAFFPEFRDPDCLVVIGLERPLSSEQQRALALDNEHRQRVRIVGFDWLAERAERILQNVISANVAVRPLSGIIAGNIHAIQGDFMLVSRLLPGRPNPEITVRLIVREKDRLRRD
jgi:hypothetical protein